MDFYVMSADAGMHRIPVQDALLSFGVTLLLGATVIWLMLYAYFGVPVFIRHFRFPLVILSGLAWGVIQHWRGGGVAGSAVLGVEAALITSLSAALVMRGIDFFRSRS